MKTIEKHVKYGSIIVLAGAGVSAGKPSALPGWKLLNKIILETLSARLESAFGWRGLGALNTEIIELLENDRFPPDYQAQLIEEMCGERYFRALQSLDVDTVNTGHENIAALAAAGTLKAVVTTNFDRLFEKALEQRRVPYQVAYDDVGFKTLCDLHKNGLSTSLPVIKIHGCVSAHLSMIDTLKQRQLGRSRYLKDCLDALGQGYWLYIGFSAADIEPDPNYLGLVNRAKLSLGGTYVTRPSNPDLRKGAQTLMNAHGDRGFIERAEIATYLCKLCNSLGVQGFASHTTLEETGLLQFKAKLKTWADGLSLAAVGLCLSAIYEAIGNAEGAVRILDRLVRHEIYKEKERDTEDYRACQLHYGRLGAAWGRFIAVRDLYEAASNASVETEQNLLRVSKSEMGFAASTWLTESFLWFNKSMLGNFLSPGLIF